MARSTPTKKSQLLKMLAGKKPKNLNQLGEKLAWQRHTVSAAITRLKQEGHVITSEKLDGKTRTYSMLPTGASGIDSSTTEPSGADAA